jgi:hypothetical protein
MNLEKRLLLGLAAVLAWAPAASAAVGFTVQFDDPTRAQSAYYSAIRANLVAAGNDWARRFNTSATATIELIVRFDNRPTLSSSSLTSSYYRTNSSGIEVYEQGAAYEARTGIDPNGATPDAEVIIGVGHLRNELWFDPAPTSSTGAVPADKTDAYSSFLHELAHIFAFAGWRDPNTGALPGNYMSTFDRYVTVGTSPFFFVGPSARTVFGQGVPLTLGNPTHLGNRPVYGLESDVMYGPSFYRGTRYSISKTDMAIVEDCGLPIKPECFTTGC